VLEPAENTADNLSKNRGKCNKKTFAAGTDLARSGQSQPRETGDRGMDFHKIRCIFLSTKHDNFSPTRGASNRREKNVKNVQDCGQF
jgi:hypothetical protein